MSGLEKELCVVNIIARKNLRSKEQKNQFFNAIYVLNLSLYWKLFYR